MRSPAFLTALVAAAMVQFLPESIPSAVAQTTPPQVLMGNWVGWGRQDTGSRWSISVTVTPTGSQVAYPSLDCGGALEPLVSEKTSARFRERLTYGLERCVDGGEVELSIAPEGGLGYRWWYPNGEEGAWGTLEPAQ